MDLWSFLPPVLVFLAEVLVVTIGTLRIIFISRGQKYLAPMLGFFESLTWLFAITKTMQNMNDWACFVAFPLGFTLGNFLGILIEKKLAMGTVVVRIITHLNPLTLIAQLRSANFGVTCVDGEGATGKVQIVMTVVKRKQLREVVNLIEAHQPNAFYAVDEVQEACEGIFPAKKERSGVVPLPLFKILSMKAQRTLQRQAAFETTSGLIAK